MQRPRCNRQDRDIATCVRPQIASIEFRAIIERREEDRERGREPLCKLARDEYRCEITVSTGDIVILPSHALLLSLFLHHSSQFHKRFKFARKEPRTPRDYSLILYVSLSFRRDVSSLVTLSRTARTSRANTVGQDDCITGRSWLSP